MNKINHKMGVALITITSLFASHSIFAAPPVITKTQSTSAKNFGVSAEQFKINFNKLALQLGAPQIENIELVNEGSEKAFHVLMPNNFAMIGNTNHDGILYRLSVGFDVRDVPKKEISDHALMLGGFAMTAFKALDQNKDDQKRDDAVQDVYESLFNDKKTASSQNIKYNFYKNFKMAAFSDPKMALIMIGAEAN
jgi:hypothetical protein